MISRIREFAKDLLSVRPGSDEVAADGEVVVIEDDEQENQKERAKKKEADPQVLLFALEDLMKCGCTDELLDKALAASAALESSDAGKGERGSASRHRKAKSLLGRIYGKNDAAKPGANGENVNDTALLIERNTVVSCMLKVGRGRSSREIDRPY